MSLPARFRINSPNVVSERFEDETILVNLHSGQYFSLRDSGEEIWRLLAGGAPLTQVGFALCALYDAQPEVIQEDASRFAADLQEHGLLVAAGEADSATQEAEAPRSEKRPYRAPAIEVHSDMQDLLLLDPIHDVDESGWPRPR